LDFSVPQKVKFSLDLNKNIEFRRSA